MDELDINGRLKKISDIEERLRKEKFILRRKNPWYKKASYWFTIITILVSIILFTLNLVFTNKSKKLTISYSKTTQLVFFNKLLKSKAEILFNKIKIDNVYRKTIRILNDGNVAITKNDFIDGPLNILISLQDTSILKNKDFPFFLDAMIVNSANQKNHSLKQSDLGKSLNIEYTPSLINPQELVEIDVFTSSEILNKLNISGKIVNGKIQNIGNVHDLAVTKPSSIYNIVDILLMFIGNKFLLVCILLVSLLIALLSCVGLFIEAIDDKWYWATTLIFSYNTFIALINVIIIILTLTY